MPAKYPSWEPTKVSWDRMMDRCYRESCNRYYRYGARGIRVCARWHSYENFLADMGERPTGMTLDRIDNDKDYSPANCRWATNAQQASNKSNTVRIGDTHLAELSRKSGIQRQTIRARMLCGWPDEMLTAPLGTRLKPGTSPKSLRKRRKKEALLASLSVARAVTDVELLLKYAALREQFPRDLPARDLPESKP